MATNASITFPGEGVNDLPVLYPAPRPGEVQE